MNETQLAEIEARAREDQMCGCRTSADIALLVAEVRQLQRKLIESNHYATGLQYELTDAVKALEGAN